MITVKQTFKLYEVVNKYFQNSEDSKILVEEIEDIMDNRIHLNMGDVATKGDITDVRADIGHVKIDLKTEIAQVKADLKTEIAQVKTDLKTEIFQVKTDLAQVKVDLAQVKSELKLEITELRSEFKVEMARGFKEQLKWILILMVSYMSITIAIIKLL